jgi:Holliday junction resolvasome RuvABC DNA-binding subunit
VKTKAVDDDNEEDEDEEEEEDKQDEKKPEVFALLVLGYVIYQIQYTVSFMYPIMKISVLLVVIFFKLKHAVKAVLFMQVKTPGNKSNVGGGGGKKLFVGNLSFRATEDTL